MIISERKQRYTKNRRRQSRIAKKSLSTSFKW
ncbi:hypothetical protein T4D_14136 [Trichinella pseudospiralis]|uniref:Uncharacterized protein n=1 Tax=Trichinella pseudospiralis TaxID=6337 RepID=A0A0V1DPP7_TRIPS|nr:hypothetical protein T4D_14136 [Trichinella pseudospiralis]